MEAKLLVFSPQNIKHIFCRRCKKSLPHTFEFFSMNSGKRDKYLRHTCRVCVRKYKREYWEKNKKQFSKRQADYRRRYPERHKKQDKMYRVKKEYGITLEEANAITALPCEICGETSKHRVIDHCHTTGKIRGTLCAKCNSVLGYIKEDIAVLENIKKYILIKCHPLKANQ